MQPKQANQECDIVTSGPSIEITGTTKFTVKDICIVVNNGEIPQIEGVTWLTAHTNDDGSLVLNGRMNVLLNRPKIYPVYKELEDEPDLYEDNYTKIISALCDGHKVSIFVYFDDIEETQEYILHCYSADNTNYIVAEYINSIVPEEALHYMTRRYIKNLNIKKTIVIEKNANHFGNVNKEDGKE